MTTQAPHTFTKPQRQGPTGVKRLLFILGAVALPLALVLIAEVSLRFAGFGGYPPLFKPVGALNNQPNTVLHVTNSDFIRTWFFNNPHQPGSIDDGSMVMPKPPNTLRIIAVGESAMRGFPQPRALASTRFLEAMLREARPDITPEVVNLGVTAIASYPVLNILTEALEYQPDAVVIYVGNNEFFGAYGVASLNRAGNTPTAMMLQRRLRSTAIVQGISKLLSKPPGPEAEGKTLMETMMGRSYTAPDDPIRGQAASNLGFFVGLMIDRCKAKNIPVMVCTLPCNQRDLAPLGDTEQSITDPAERERIKKLMLDMSTRVLSEPAAAESELRAAIEKHPLHARAWFWLGKALEKQAKIDESAQAFQKACDLDPMPWRPPGGSNAALRAVVKERGAALCDLESAFNAQSRKAGQAATGWNLMDDHVHPSLEGQHLVARTILDTMAELSGPARVTPEQAAKVSDFETLAPRLGANDYERYGVAHQMRVLGRIAFFKETNPGMQARFDAVCDGFAARWDQKLRDAAVEWQKPETHRGAKRPISAMMGKVLVSQGKLPEALALFDSAAQSVFAYTSWSLEYELFRFGILEAAGPLSDAEKARARAALDRGLLLINRPGADSAITQRHVGVLHQVLGEYEQSIPYLNAARSGLGAESRVACDMALVQALVKSNRPTDAMKVLADGAKNAGQFAPQYQKVMNALSAQLVPAEENSKPANQQSNK
jgi:tetratricopeptide (TPR) repeat protein